MLKHINGSIPTSLTKLNPMLAGFSVWIFSHIIRVIENEISAYPELLLRNLINIGRTCLILRDEIFLQIIKQITDNDSIDCTIRLWKLLRACLRHFPPSDAFENYLEYFLHSQLLVKSDIESAFISSCIRFMHEGIFLFGYNKKITSHWNSSLARLKEWLYPSENGNNSLKHVTPQRKDMLPTDISFALVDPAFVPDRTYVDNSAMMGKFPASVARAFTKPVLRGSRDDWTYRYASCSSSESVCHPSDLQRKIESSGSKLVDPIDSAILKFWICGQIPSLAIMRDLRKEVAVETVFHHTLPEESAKSEGRRGILRSSTPPPFTEVQESSEKLGSLVKSFWDTIVQSCFNSDAQNSLIPAEKTTTTSRKLSTSFLSISRSEDPVDGDIFAAESSSPVDFFDNSRSKLNGSKRAESMLSMEAYRDIVMIGIDKVMKLLLDTNK
jgi:hypothetical protein